MSEHKCQIGKVRQFDSGATRSAVTTFDPSGFISPVAMLVFCRYMEKHRFQQDGKLRDSDNWKKGIPQEAYFQSLIRHVLELWLRMDRYNESSQATVYPGEAPTIEDTLCAIMFNVQGLLHERVKGMTNGQR